MRRLLAFLAVSAAAAIGVGALAGGTPGRAGEPFGNITVATFRAPNCGSPPPPGGDARPCPYTTIGVRIAVMPAGGRGPKERLRTVPDGFESLGLPPGRYELRPRGGKRTRRAGLLVPPSETVEITAGGTTEAIFVYKPRFRMLSPPAPR